MAKRCIVIGGGVAGIAAATRLTEAGWSVDLYERKRTLGGRAGSFQDRETGDLLDIGPHLLAGCYRETFRLLKRMGVDDQLLLSKRMVVPYVLPDGRTEILDGGRWPAPLHLLRGLLGFGALNWRSRLNLLRMAPPLLAVAMGGASHLRGMNAVMWLRSCGQTEEALRVLWEPLILACLNTIPRKASAELFARVAAQLFLGGRRSATLGTGIRGLEPLFGASAQQFLERRNCQVWLGKAIKKILIRNHSVEGILLPDGELRQADVYVVAVPPQLVLELLPDDFAFREPFKYLRMFQDSAICSLYLWTDRPITDLPFAHLRTRRFEWLFNLNALMPGQTFSGPIVGLENSAANWMISWTKDEMVEAARDDLAACFPHARNAAVLRAKVSKEKSATFAADPKIDGLRPANETPLCDLYFAGDWTDTGYPGTIEGAVLSGHRAAELIIQSEQKPTVPPVQLFSVTSQPDKHGRIRKGAFQKYQLSRRTRRIRFYDRFGTLRFTLHYE